MKRFALFSLSAVALLSTGCFNRTTQDGTDNPDDVAGEGGEGTDDGEDKSSRIRMTTSTKEAKSSSKITVLTDKAPRPEDEENTDTPPPDRMTGSAPEIAGLAPNVGAPGTVVEIYGTGFNKAADKNTVKVGGTKWDVTEVFGDRILAVVPDGAASGDMEVTAQRKKASAGSFTVLRDDAFHRPAPDRHGLFGEVFAVSAGTTSMPDFDSLGAPAAVIAVPDLAVSGGTSAGFPGLEPGNFAIRFSGSLNITEAGEYEFCLESDDGSQLALEGTLVVDNVAGPDVVKACELVYLEAGEYGMAVHYLEGDAGPITLNMTWSKDGGAAATIPAPSLFRPLYAPGMSG